MDHYPDQHAIKAEGEWIHQMKADGARFARYRTPCCGEEREIHAPPIMDALAYSTMTECPHCGQIYYTAIGSDGLMTIRIKLEVE